MDRGRGFGVLTGAAGFCLAGLLVPTPASAGTGAGLDIVAPHVVVPPDILGTCRTDRIDAQTIWVQSGGTIDLRAGDDSISAAAQGSTSYGMNVEGVVALGSGDDRVGSSGTFTGFQVVGEMTGGNGNDRLLGRGDSTGYLHNSNGVEVFLGRLDTGNGSDELVGEARGVVTGNVAQGITVYMAGSVVLGNANDRIRGLGVEPNGFGYGIAVYSQPNGQPAGAAISAGAGNDRIEGFGTAAGFIGGPVRGDAGNDTFLARRIDATGTPLADQVGAVQGVELEGGSGDDRFDVGFGDGTIRGGSGEDTVVLPRVPGGYEVARISGGFSVTAAGRTLTLLGVEHIRYA